MEHPIDTGRLNVARAFLHDDFGVNIGSGNVRFKNKVNVDLSKEKADPDVLADVRHMPFKGEVFCEVVLTDVLEHVPEGSEVESLREIERIMVRRGRLVLSVPNNSLLMKVLDPVFWMKGHRHYKPRQLRKFFNGTGLTVQKIFSSGRLPFGVVTLSYALNWLLRRKKVDLCKSLVLRAYDGDIGNKGGTLYAVARRQ